MGEFEHPAADATPPELAAAFASVGLPLFDRDTLSPLVNAEALAAALIDRNGTIVAASPRFHALAVHPDLLARIGADTGNGAAVAGLAGSPGDARATTFAYALAARAAGWRLPPEVARAARAHPGHVVVLTSQAVLADGPLTEACHAYGLSGLQTRVAIETIRAGAVRGAARAAGVSYHTAREALEAAMQRVRAPRLPALVSKLTSLAFGVLPVDGHADGERILGDAWGLSQRQASIAGLIAEGISRAATAQALSISAAVVKKELDRVYAILGVTSAAALAQQLAEARALAWLTRSTAGDLGFVHPGLEPVRFVHRPDAAGRIAFSDYGPASGRPVLVVHSSMTTRIVARSLLRALQGAGYRPLSIDRPGFGLTDEVAGMQPGEHDPYATATADAFRVLDHLKLRRVDVVARGGAQFVLALACAAPQRLGRVVLVNPAPHTQPDDRSVGALGAIKEAFRRNPGMIRLAAAVIIRQSSLERVAQFMRRSMKDSPPDAAACLDPDLVRDYFRATRTFATGRIGGYVNEQTEFARGMRPQPFAGAADWRVLIAAHDVLHDPRHVLDYWSAVLPDARFDIVPDTGRLLALSHPQLVAAALLQGRDSGASDPMNDGSGTRQATTDP